VGISGRIAQAFLRSKLTPLVTGAALAVGLVGILATPREEEPQISVPMIDVLAALPGASPAETENLLVRPIERRMWEIPGVEYVYSTAGEGWALVTVRYAVGQDQEISVAKVHAVVRRNGRGAGRAAAARKPHSIDDAVCMHALPRRRHDRTSCARSPAIWRTRSVRSPTFRRRRSSAASRSASSCPSTGSGSQPAA
jgi:hypothetical protein